MPLLEIETRRASVSPASLDREAGTVEAVLSRGAAVRRSGWTEILAVAPENVTVAARLPVLDAHRQTSIADIKGRVESVRFEDGAIIGPVANLRSRRTGRHRARRRDRRQHRLPRDPMGGVDRPRDPRPHPNRHRLGASRSLPRPDPRRPGGHPQERSIADRNHPKPKRPRPRPSTPRPAPPSGRSPAAPVWSPTGRTRGSTPAPTSPPPAPPPSRPCRRARRPSARPPSARPPKTPP